MTGWWLPLLVALAGLCAVEATARRTSGPRPHCAECANTRRVLGPLPTRPTPSSARTDTPGDTDAPFSV